MRPLALLFALFASGTIAFAGDSWSETFGDWRATCFPGGGCEASTGDQGGSSPDDTLRLIIERSSADSQAWHIAIEFHRKPARTDRALTLAVADGQEFTFSAGSGFKAFRAAERFYITDAKALRALLPAVLAGDRIRIAYFDVSGEARSFDLSLAGVTASMIWIEGELKMAGAPRIAVPPTGLPEAPPPLANPVVEAGIPEIVWAHHERTSACELYDDQRMRDLGNVIEPLSDTAILYALPCTAHAYNVTFRLYLRELGEIGGVRTLYFADYSTATNWSGTDLLYNISVDGKALTAFYKGRGLGDCGAAGEWIWQDHEFRLVRYRLQEKCNGVLPDKWPVIFPDS